MNAEFVPAALVFGAAGGIGSELARGLSRAGFALALSGRSPESIEPISQEVGGLPLVCDVTNAAEVDQAFEKVVSYYGRLDAVALCVGSLLLKPAHLTSDDEWQQTLLLNLTSAFHVVRAAAKQMKQGGSVVLFASAAARIGLPNHEAIAAAKAGIVGLATSAAATYASRGLRFNVIAPGLVKTKLSEKIWKNELAAQASQGMHPVGRLGEPAEVASLATWLMHPEQSWVTGQVFGIDGGLATLKTPARKPST